MGWPSSTPAPAAPCRSTARRRASSRPWAGPASPRARAPGHDCRFADGRELALARLPPSEPAGVVALRDEVIVLAVPDGREVALVNAAPIRGDGGEVESVVVTLQDLGPIEKAERLQTELLGMVSHELRSPLTAIKGSTATVLAPRPPRPGRDAAVLPHHRRAGRPHGRPHRRPARASPPRRRRPTPRCRRPAGRAGRGEPRDARPRGRRDPHTRRYVCDASRARLAAADPGELPELVRTKKPRRLGPRPTASS